MTDGQASGLDELLNRVRHWWDHLVYWVHYGYNPEVTVRTFDRYESYVPTPEGVVPITVTRVLTTIKRHGRPWIRDEFLHSAEVGIPDSIAYPTNDGVAFLTFTTVNTWHEGAIVGGVVEKFMGPRLEHGWEPMRKVA